MLSRNLATSLGINIAPGVRVASAADVRAFAQTVGYPVMIKALDGGGGRGIRVVDAEARVEEAFKRYVILFISSIIVFSIIALSGIFRCLGESPSKQVFVERALTGPGWKHIEIQVIGDGAAVNHLWERECSVQRR
jgi:pyruvate carboxylase